ncbi:MAG: hypothetical protein MPJ25_06980 [Pirellulales bacterium]|nr:hypothetical protein [Pirellulales bacterium]
MIKIDITDIKNGVLDGSLLLKDVKGRNYAVANVSANVFEGVLTDVEYSFDEDSRDLVDEYLLQAVDDWYGKTGSSIERD